MGGHSGPKVDYNALPASEQAKVRQGVNNINGQTGARAGSKNGGPVPPDFYGAAQDQTAANRPNQTGPFGSSTWTQGPDGQWSQNVTLTPGLNDAAQGIIGGLGNQLDPSAMRDQAINSAYTQATSRLDPQWQERMAAADTQAINRGLTPGSRAYDSQMGTLNNARNDAYAQALLNAQTGAGNAAFGQALAANMQPYQQLSALQGLTKQGSFMPGADLASALAQQYGGQLAQQGMSQQGKNSMMSGAGQIAPYLFL